MEKYRGLREKLKEEARMKMREENRVMFSDYCPPPPPPSKAVGGSKSFLPPAAKRRRVLPPRVLQDQETTTAELSGKLRPSLSLSTAAAHTTCSSSPPAKAPAVPDTPPERIGKNGLLILRFKLTPEMRRIMATPPPPPTKKRPRESQEPTRRRSPMRAAPIRIPQAAAAPIHERVSTQTPPSTQKRPRQSQEPTLELLRRNPQLRDAKAKAAPIRDESMMTTPQAHEQRERVSKTRIYAPYTGFETSDSCPRTPPLRHHNKGTTRTTTTPKQYYAPVWIPWTPLSPTVTWSPDRDPTYHPNNPTYDPSFTP